MSRTLQLIKEFVARGEIRISEHGYDELAADDISVEDILSGVQKDPDGLPIHVVWGIPKGAGTPAVVVTAYRPEKDKWSDDFKTRL